MYSGVRRLDTHVHWDIASRHDAVRRYRFASCRNVNLVATVNVDCGPEFFIRQALRLDLMAAHIEFVASMNSVIKV